MLLSVLECVCIYLFMLAHFPSTHLADQRAGDAESALRLGVHLWGGDHVDARDAVAAPSLRYVAAR